MKAFIINYNRLTLPKKMAEYLFECGLEPVIVDNNSDYKPLLNYYDSCPFEVIRLNHNYGHRVVWDVNLISELPDDERYIVTDSDLDLSDVPKDFLDVLNDGLNKYPEYEKCSLSLDISDLPNTHVGLLARETEKGYWDKPLDEMYFDATTDTTFGLYKVKNKTFKSLRTNKPYCAKHVPWYYDKIEDLPEDEQYYLNTYKTSTYYTRRYKERKDAKYDLVVIISYYDRPQQLNKTLKSIFAQKKNVFVVVITNEGDILNLSDFDNTDVLYVPKLGMNPEYVVNFGLSYVVDNINTNKIMLQHAECYHVGNVLSYAIEHTNKSSYISFGTYSLDKENTFNDDLDVNEMTVNVTRITGEGTNGWYNHPLYRPKGYDFCAVMSKTNWIKLNGYDERFCEGIGYGDNYLVYRVKLLGLGVEITDYPFVVHQWHYNGNKQSLHGVSNKEELINKNRVLYDKLTRENDYKAKHIYTKDLCKGTI
jgi:hypothetical protein